MAYGPQNPFDSTGDYKYGPNNPYGLDGERLKKYKQQQMLGNYQPTDQQRRMQMAYRMTGNEYATGNPEDNPNYKAQQAPEDELTKLRKAMGQQDDQFSKNSGLLKQQMFTGFADQERRRLADQMTKINEGASRRGLLYSGIRQGAQAGAQGESAQTLAKTRYGINRGVDETARLLKANAAKAELQSVDQTQNLEDAIYGNALQNMAMKNRAIGDIFSGVGYLGGAYIGGSLGGESPTKVAPGVSQSYGSRMGGYFSPVG